MAIGKPRASRLRQPKTALRPAEIERSRALEFGATHAFATMDEAMGPATDLDVKLSMFELTLLQKGAIFGGTGPRSQVPALLHHYRSGALKLDELVTKTYRLDEINQGYADTMDGKNLRGSSSLRMRITERRTVYSS